MGFGFERPAHISPNKSPLRRGVAIFVMLCGLIILQGYRTYVQSQDIYTYMSGLLEQVGYRTTVLDPDLSQMAIYAGEVLGDITSVARGEDTQSHISRLLVYIDELSLRPTRSGLVNEYISLLDGISEFDDDVLSLLGFGAPQTYIVVLQNASEVRPNGGFFGSFALLTLDSARVSKMEIIDSYHPAWENPDLRIQGPERLTEFLPDRDIYFVGANKTGYTYHDGAHIQQLYERAYPRQPIRGVVFVSTDMIAQILPDFIRAQRERQFVNAATDLIRGGGFGKKEIYLNQSAEYFTEHQMELATGIIKGLPSLIDQRYINVYLDDISVSGGEQGGGLTQRLRDHQLTTRYEDDYMYVWGSNISYNKIDTFITKTTTLTDSAGRVYMQTTDDIIDLSRIDISAGSSLEIIYQLQIPDSYRQYIWSLEDEYGIELTDRERHILGLTPGRGTRALIYLPAGVQAKSVDGRAREVKIFQTPFTHAVSFETDIQADGGESRVRVELE